MPKCKVCSHPQRAELTRALVLNIESDRGIAKQFGLTASSVFRHRRNHLRPYLSEQIAQDLELADVNPLAEAKALFYRVRTMLDKSEDAEDLPAFKALHSEARRDLELLAKLLGDLKDGGVQVNNYVHPRREGQPSREEQFEQLFADIEEY